MEKYESTDVVVVSVIADVFCQTMYMLGKTKFRLFGGGRTKRMSQRGNLNAMHNKER